MPDFTPVRRSFAESCRALYRVFGFGSVAVTAVGFVASVGVVFVAVSRDIAWSEIVVVGGCPCLLVVGGLWSLWERWLSFGVVEGLRPATFTSRSWLRVFLCVLLCSLAVAFLCAAVSDSLPAQQRSLALALVGGSLVGACIPLAMLLLSPRYWLVREGIAIRHRGGRSLIPWSAIRSAGLGTTTGNSAIAIHLDWTELSIPLRTVWTRELDEGAKEKIKVKLLKGFGTVMRWSGANLMITDITCKMPAGVLLVRLALALRSPAAREVLPPFGEQIGDCSSSPTPAGETESTAGE